VIATTGPSSNALDDPCRVRTHVLLEHVFDAENGNIRLADNWEDALNFTPVQAECRCTGVKMVSRQVQCVGVALRSLARCLSWSEKPADRSCLHSRWCSLTACKTGRRQAEVGGEHVGQPVVRITFELS
jgi:hypothetical protein